jgi:hypothetical protein
MTAEFISHCNHYFQLTQLLAKRRERLQKLLDNAPYYCGKTSLNELYAIVCHCRKAQVLNAKVEKTLNEVKATGRMVRMIMRHFEIPPGAVPAGEIPGELTYQVRADEYDELYISKPKQLAPRQDHFKGLVIKLRRSGDGEKD